MTQIHGSVALTGVVLVETQFLQDLATDLGPFSDIFVDSDINEAYST